MTTELCLWREGAVEVVLASDRLLEAPNWHLEGYLVVNGNGLLWRVPLDAPRLERIDTGPLRALNNDHGISPDGRLIAVSDGRPSRVWLLPAGGGMPRLVTENAPSYWHGWSPDGARLAFVADRGAGFQVYEIAAAGGAERALTEGFFHCDGPDYAPDGTLWFNGETEAGVDLWRLGPEGPERMTEGPSVDWFPHPSPDGTRVLYLAFPPGTQGHPRGRDVELRLMPSGGGPYETIVRLHGGQGTINVPCWSPDGRAFAFARYAPEAADTSSPAARPSSPRRT